MAIRTANLLKDRPSIRDKRWIRLKLARDYFHTLRNVLVCRYQQSDRRPTKIGPFDFSNQFLLAALVEILNSNFVNSGIEFNRSLTKLRRMNTIDCDHFLTSIRILLPSSDPSRNRYLPFVLMGRYESKTIANPLLRLESDRSKSLTWTVFTDLSELKSGSLSHSPS